ncbi:MAG: single-stranded DNA-binding protein [Phycisphaerales bacterium]|nr:MAG: single-stranded DNA-binding protein [Phycisphaerales bacterium]
MGNLNKVFLMGNLTRDVELRSTSGSNQVARIGLAVNRHWTSPDGEKKEETTFVDCEAWGRTAENIARFFSKGRPIFIEGRLKLDQWQDKDSGQNRSKMLVVVESFQFVDSKGGGGGGGEGGGGGGNYSSAPRQASRSASGTGSGRPAPAHEPEPDDIPF